MRALRAAVPRVEISLSTGLWITSGDVDARARAISDWTERPDLVSLNLSEDGWRELATLLAERGIGIEAGVWTARDAELLAESGLVAMWGKGSRGTRHHPPVHRILVEPRSENAEEAVAVAREIDAALDAARVPTAAAAPRRRPGDLGGARRRRAARARDPDRARGRAHAPRRAPRA